MKNSVIDALKTFFRDRTMTTLFVVLLLVTIGYVLYVALSLQPSDLQVATRYTAFGDTHFYRNKWYYLLTFIFFGIMVTTVHAALAVKLHARGQRSLSIALLAFTLLLLAVGWILTRSVLRIAFL